MKNIMICALAVLLGAAYSPAAAKDKKKKTVKTEQTFPTALLTPVDSLSYSAGYSLTNGLDGYLKQQFGLSDADFPAMIQGFRDAAARRNDPDHKAYNAGVQVAGMVLDRMVPNLQGELASGSDSLDVEMVLRGFEAALSNDTTLFDVQSADSYFQTARTAVVERKNQANKLAGEQFLAENESQPGVVTLPSGLQYKVIKTGNGATPSVSDKVKVIYEGRTIDGKVFDATSKHGTETDEFGLSGLIKGWQEAMTRMPVGSKWEIYIPYNLAYGERGAGRDIQPYSALIFTLELVDIVK